MKKSGDPKKLLYKLNDLREAHPRLKLLENSHSSLLGELLKVQKEAREFGEKYIAAAALSIDKKWQKIIPILPGILSKKPWTTDFSVMPFPRGLAGWDIQRLILPF